MNLNSLINMKGKQLYLFPRARIILVGAAASGKDFVRQALSKRGFKHAVSYTTRPPRPGEVDGKDYYFISVKEFEKKISQGFWYEYVPFNSWYYGTSKEQMETCDIFIMTPSGISKLHPEDRKNSFIIFMDIPENIRRERLAVRIMPGDNLERRIEADKKDFENFTDFDLKINSSDLAEFM